MNKITALRLQTADAIRLEKSLKGTPLATAAQRYSDEKMTQMSLATLKFALGIK